MDFCTTYLEHDWQCTCVQAPSSASQMESLDFGLTVPQLWLTRPFWRKASVVNPKRMVRLTSFALWFQPETGPTMTLSCFQLEQLRSVSNLWLASHVMITLKLGVGLRKLTWIISLDLFLIRPLFSNGQESVKSLPNMNLPFWRLLLLRVPFASSLRSFLERLSWKLHSLPHSIHWVQVDLPWYPVASQVRLVVFPRRGWGRHMKTVTLQKNDPCAASSRAVVAAGVKWDHLKLSANHPWTHGVKKEKIDWNRFHVSNWFHGWGVLHCLYNQNPSRPQLQFWFCSLASKTFLVLGCQWLVMLYLCSRLLWMSLSKRQYKRMVLPVRGCV